MKIDYFYFEGSSDFVLFFKYSNKNNNRNILQGESVLYIQMLHELCLCALESKQF